MKLAVSASWPQIDGGTRYALDIPSRAREVRALARYDRARAEAFAGRVLVTRLATGEVVAHRWPGRVPPWTEIHDALAEWLDAR